MTKFQIFRRADGQYEWRLKSANGRIIATAGQGFKRKSGAKRGIDAVKNDASRARIEDTTNPNAATTRSAAPVDESTGLDTVTTYLALAASGQYEDAWTMCTDLYQGLGENEDSGAAGIGFASYDDFVSFWELVDEAGIDALVSSELRDNGARRLLSNIWYGGSDDLPRQDELVEMDVIVDDDGDFKIDRYFIIEPVTTDMVEVIDELNSRDDASAPVDSESALQS